jgi:hypothetical protein
VEFRSTIYTMAGYHTSDARPAAFALDSFLYKTKSICSDTSLWAPKEMPVDMPGFSIRPRRWNRMAPYLHFFCICSVIYYSCQCDTLFSAGNFECGNRTGCQIYFVKGRRSLSQFFPGKKINRSKGVLLTS